jgi:hypothetical protein
MFEAGICVLDAISHRQDRHLLNTITHGRMRVAVEFYAVIVCYHICRMTIQNYGRNIDFEQLSEAVRI